MSSPRERAEKLYTQLQAIQEPKGYFFHNDKEMVLEILEQLDAKKTSFGYMSCPCRLGHGTLEKDRDILCPCAYREADVKEFGACYCRLYVCKDWLEDKIFTEVVPERRPIEKLL